jgi:hypothetical protein
MKLSSDLNKETLFDQLCESLKEFQIEKEVDDRYQKIWDDLYKTMDEKHIEILHSEFKQMEEARNSGRKYYHSLFCEVCCLMVIFHDHYNRLGERSLNPGPLRMPFELAEILMQKKDVESHFTCPGCKYFWLPISRKTGESYFTRCPLCETDL